jgi:hypothetical protein
MKHLSAHVIKNGSTKKENKQLDLIGFAARFCSNVNKQAKMPSSFSPSTTLLPPDTLSHTNLLYGNWASCPGP